MNLHWRKQERILRVDMRHVSSLERGSYEKASAWGGIAGGALLSLTGAFGEKFAAAQTSIGHEARQRVAARQVDRATTTDARLELLNNNEHYVRDRAEFVLKEKAQQEVNKTGEEYSDRDKFYPSPTHSFDQAAAIPRIRESIILEEFKALEDTPKIFHARPEWNDENFQAPMNVVFAEIAASTGLPIYLNDFNQSPFAQEYVHTAGLDGQTFFGALQRVVTSYGAGPRLFQGERGCIHVAPYLMDPFVTYATDKSMAAYLENATDPQFHVSVSFLAEPECIPEGFLIHSMTLLKEDGSTIDIPKNLAKYPFPRFLPRFTFSKNNPNKDLFIRNDQMLNITFPDFRKNTRVSLVVDAELFGTKIRTMKVNDLGASQKFTTLLETGKPFEVEYLKTDRRTDGSGSIVYFRLEATKQRTKVQDDMRVVFTAKDGLPIIPIDTIAPTTENGFIGKFELSEEGEESRALHKIKLRVPEYVGSSSRVQFVFPDIEIEATPAPLIFVP